MSLITLLLGACDEIEQSEQTPSKQDVINTKSNGKNTANANQTDSDTARLTPGEKLPKTSFKTIEWTDLMPKDDLDALLNPPDYLSEIEDGSIEDQITSQVQSTIAAANDDRYQQALVSTRVVSEMNDQAIRIPGFVVPVEFDDEQIITQFFLVPFFGACIHMPPPPPNQIIFVEYPKGLQLESLYDPFWISGILQTSLVENEIAKATYSLNLQYFEKYYE
ncbi:DUF3299 domain-containing protein [Aliikangiella coralliicola]|uniref:DUF3299 domain-containing protein n=1 Tax=Aliikangiella coralliicola TaxID=2592383 RepID=UPI001AEFF291|nr:DUF3299 domain-containing protein [Aliikangiella coralliicola]